MSEAELSHAIREALAARRIIVGRTQAGKIRINERYWMQLCPVGWPDLTGVLPGGRFLGLEVKLPKQKPSAHQLAWHERARAMGALVEVVHSVDEALAVIGNQP